MKTLAISIPSDDLFKDDFCNDKRIALLQHTVLCIRVHTTGPTKLTQTDGLKLEKTVIL